MARAVVNQFAEQESDPFKTARWAEFAREVDELGREARALTGPEDFAHLRKMERWGRLATVVGYATAWIAPNPLSAYLISQGNFARWAVVLHPISHGAMDRVPGIPARYTSKRFARGWRRFFDWMDWIKPENWHLEHDQLHHYHLGTEKDPDVVWRNAEKIRTLPIPHFLRMTLAFVVACVWKPFYYAPNTVMEARHHRRLAPSNKIGWNTWNPMTPEGRELWMECLLPYALLRFALIPLLFSPLGKGAVIAVLLNSLFAELMTNLHSFAAIGPNHTGDDVPVFDTPSKSRAEFYYRQIAGSINFPAGGDVRDFFYGGLNYQIEHHLWPTASLLQCQRLRPRLQEICARYDIPYIEAGMLSRVLVTLRTMAGSCAPANVVLKEVKS